MEYSCFPLRRTLSGGVALHERLRRHAFPLGSFGMHLWILLHSAAKGVADSCTRQLRSKQQAITLNITFQKVIPELKR